MVVQIANNKSQVLSIDKFNNKQKIITSKKHIFIKIKSKWSNCDCN